MKWAVAEKFCEYLIGSHTVVLTDNNPLAYLHTTKMGATEQRWVAQLTAFGKDFVVEVDASLKDLGACLSQHDDGKLHPQCLRKQKSIKDVQRRIIPIIQASSLSCLD